MNNETKKGKMVPELRFPGFEGEWEMKRIEDSFQERVEKNRGDLPLLSLGEEGLMLQSESQRKDNSNSDKSKYLRVAVGDIAYNTMRMWQGRCVHCDIEGIVSPAYTVCKPKEGIDPLFHYYLFKTNQMIGIFHQHSQGLVNDTLNLKYEAFSKIKYLVPSLPEQQKIAECLSSVDDLIQAEADQLQALKDHKKGLMQQLFPQEGETTSKLRFPGFEGEWEEKKLGEVFDFRNGYTPSKNNVEYWDGGTIPWFRMDDIREKGNILSDASQHITENAIKGEGLFKAGSIIVATSATIGEHALVTVDYLANQRFTNLYPKNEYINKIDIMYAYYYMFVVDEICKHTVNIGTFASVNMASFARIPFYIPSFLPEQQKIASCLSSLDEGIAAQQEKVEALKEHKKGLMQKLFPTIN